MDTVPAFYPPHTYPPQFSSEPLQQSPKRWGHENREVTVSNGVKITISYPQGENDRVQRSIGQDLIVLKEAVAMLESIVQSQERNRK